MKKRKKNVIMLTDEQLLKLQQIIRRLLRGESVQMNIYNEKDKAAGEQILKALKPRASW